VRVVFIVRWIGTREGRVDLDPHYHGFRHFVHSEFEGLSL